jgi:hypothetical protein
MCNLYSITTNQAAIIALFRVINRYVGNLPPMTVGIGSPLVAGVASLQVTVLDKWTSPPVKKRLLFS